jgi:hypothetical protein
MPEFKFSSSEPLWVAAWVVYILTYCATLAYLLNRRRFGTNERILWFLVISFAPVIGILLFVFISEDDKISDGDAAKKAGLFQTPLALRGKRILGTPKTPLHE